MASSYAFPSISSHHPPEPLPQQQSLSAGSYNRSNTWNTHPHPHDFFPPSRPTTPTPLLPSQPRSSSPLLAVTQKRPPSIAQLTQRAGDYSFYSSHWQSLESLSNDAEEYHKLAKKQNAQGDYEEAFVNYTKAATIFRERLPQHRDYHILLSDTQKSAIHGNGQAILNVLSRIELILADQYEKWQAAAIAMGPSITNAPRLPYKSLLPLSLPTLSSSTTFSSSPLEWSVATSRAKDEEYLKPRVPQQDRPTHLRSKSTSQLPPGFVRDSYSMADYAVLPTLMGDANNSNFLAPSYNVLKTTPTQDGPTIFGVKDLTNEVRIIYDEKLGTGGFSEVFKASYTIEEDANKAVAVKKLTIANFKNKSMAERASRLKKRLAREVRVWRSLSHANIVPLLGVYMGQSDTFPGMVMPFYRHGSAYHYLRTREFSILEKFTLMYEIACGLAYLHTCRPPIVHGDLKAQNVLIDNGGHAMLSDFGISRIVEKTLEPTGTTTSGPVEASLRWSAPEVILNDETTRFTPASDIWSFACTGYEILTGKIPYYQSLRSLAVVAHILKHEVPTWPATAPKSNATNDKHEDIPSSVINFIDSLWKFNERERGEMAHIATRMQLMLRFVDNNSHY